MRRAALASCLLLIAAAVSAQEFDRASGGELQMAVKQPSQLSTTLGFRFGSGKAFEGAIGGTLIRDRMWFFASGIRSEARPVSAFLPQTTAIAPPSSAVDAKFTAQLDARQLMTGSYVDTTSPLAIPQSFLSLRYTGIISSNAFFTASVSKTR